MFYLFANCNFVPDKYDDWQAAYDDLATYVWKSEPTTLTYYFGIPLDYGHDFSKTTSMFAFEVYGTREDLYQTHLSSPAMTKFLAAIPTFSTTGLDLSHYRCVGGYLDLPGDKRECGIMQDTRVVCFSSSARTKMLASLQKLAGRIEKNEKAALKNGTKREVNGEGKESKGGGEGKGGVFTYQVFQSLDDEVSARIFARFRDREAMEQFLRREEVVRFGWG